MNRPMVSADPHVAIGYCPSCGGLWTVCDCGRPTPPGALDTFEPEPPAEPAQLVESPRLPTKGLSATELAARAREHDPERFTKPGAGEPFVEWVQWRGKSGELSRYHVRLNTGGFLLCGRTAPKTAAADSFAPIEQRCSVCRSKIRELAS